MSNYILTSDGELYHYGVPGMKWGQRKAAQMYEPGSLTKIPSVRKADQTIKSDVRAYKKSLKGQGVMVREGKLGKRRKETALQIKRDSQKLRAEKKKKKQNNKANKDKEDIQRMINALDQHQKAMTISSINSSAGMALRSAGQGRTATLLNEFGNWQVSRLSASSGYDFWR